MEKLDKKIFTTLFFSILAAVMGVGIVVPLLPVYAHDLGASGVYIGLIFGAFSLSRTFLLPYFGRLSDQKGRKPLIVTGLLAYALVSIAFIFSETVETLILLRFLQGIASAMIMPVSLAYVGDITPVGQPDAGRVCRHKTADLGHQHDQGHLPQKGGFTGHIGASNYKQMIDYGIKERIVRNKRFN